MSHGRCVLAALAALTAATTASLRLLAAFAFAFATGTSTTPAFATGIALALVLAVLPELGLPPILATTATIHPHPRVGSPFAASPPEKPPLCIRTIWRSSEAPWDMVPHRNLLLIP